MNPPSIHFPALAADARLAGHQRRQTQAMGLLPLGLSLLFMAAATPQRPPAGLWRGVAGAIGGMVLLEALWRAARRGGLRAYAIWHWLLRYAFIALCPLLLWFATGPAILEKTGPNPPLLLGGLLLLYPLGRVLAELARARPRPAPALRFALVVVRQLQIAVVALAAAGILLGVILEAQGDLPTDPTPIVLLISLLVTLVLLAGVIQIVAGVRGDLPPAAPRPTLDDPPPPPPENPVKYGSERF